MSESGVEKHLAILWNHDSNKTLDSFEFDEETKCKLDCTLKEFKEFVINGTSTKTPIGLVFDVHHESENIDSLRCSVGMLIDPDKKDEFDKAANEYFKKCSKTLLRGE